MAYFPNDCTEREDLGNGIFRDIIGIKPVARLVNGTRRRIEHRVVDTGSDPLRLRAYGALDAGIAATLNPGEPVIGIRRNGKGLALIPVGINARVGSNVKDGTGNIIGREWLGAWTGTKLRFFFGGHFLRKEIELSANHPNTFDFKILRSGNWTGNLPRLTTRGFDIDDDAGKPLMWAHKPYLYHPTDETKPSVPVNMILRQVNSEWYLRLALPAPINGATDWSGWTLEPTWSSQPAAAAGEDTVLLSDFPDSNSDAAGLGIGEYNTSARIARALIKFNQSSLPDNASFSLPTLSLYAITDRSSNARTFRVYRQLRAWVEAEATWNIYSTGNSWATAGGFGATDCEQTDIGSCDLTATETLNQFKTFALTPTTKAALDLGNGWLMKADTETDDGYVFVDSDNATAANRPLLTVPYTLLTGDSQFNLASTKLVRCRLAKMGLVGI